MIKTKIPKPEDANFLEYMFYHKNGLDDKEIKILMKDDFPTINFEEYANDHRAHIEIRELFSLSLWQKFKLMKNGHVFITHATKEGWKGKLPFHIVRCKTHKILFFDYPHGFEGYNQGFDCPLCIKEKVILVRKLLKQ